MFFSLGPHRQIQFRPQCIGIIIIKPGENKDLPVGVDVTVLAADAPLAYFIMVSPDKVQVQHMVQHMLKLPAKPQADAADALGVAICHANTNKTLVALAGKATSARKGRYR